MEGQKMKKSKYFEALSENLQSQADEKAGYPPNCNEGYVEKDGKCVPVETDTEASAEDSELTMAPLNCPMCYNKGGSVCEKGQVWNEKAGKCIPCPDCEKKDAEADWRNPEKYMKDGGQVCPKGQHWDKKAKKCVPMKEGDC